MRIYAKIYSFIAVALGAFNACSLIHDDPEDCQLYTPEGVPYAYVAVAFNTGMNTSTRSNPTGGEDGDGPEVGQSNENQVNDITLFFYETSETSGLNQTQQNPGVNMDPATPIVAQRHFGDGEFTYNGTNAQTNPVEVTQLLVNHSYHVLAVVNGGESFGDTITRLGSLQQAVVQKIYDYDAPSSTSGSNPTQAGYSNFLMASADDEDSPLKILPNNSVTNYAHTVIDVERVSARVDYMAQGSEGHDDGTYIVTPGFNSEQIDTARITGAMLMNVLNADAPSWLLKRVADSFSFTETDWTYLGKETYVNNAGSIAANYVIDAISSKTKDDFVTATYFKNFSYENLAWESQFKDPFFTLEDGYNCIGYPKENVNQLGDKGLTTGVVFRAQYTPKGMTEGQTFFEWDGTVYPSLEAMMEAKFESSWEIIKGEWNDIKTWEDLRANIISKLADDPVGYKAYLREVSGNESGDIDVSTLRWASYLKTECYYINDNGTVTVDAAGVDAGTTRRIFHDLSGLATYKDGICYYTYWIKHANDQNEDNNLVGSKDKTGGVMEYAIVRNNVYKLNVTSIAGPGGDIPGDRNVNVNVLVEDWQLISPGEDIELEPVTANGQN